MHPYLWRQQAISGSQFLLLIVHGQIPQHEDAGRSFLKRGIDTTAPRLPVWRAPLARRRMQMVNHITLCISLGGMLDTTDLSVPSGVGSSPAGKSSRRDSLALCSFAQ